MHELGELMVRFPGLRRHMAEAPPPHCGSPTWCRLDGRCWIQRSADGVGGSSGGGSSGGGYIRGGAR